MAIPPGHIKRHDAAVAAAAAARVLGRGWQLPLKKKKPGFVSETGL